MRYRAFKRKKDDLFYFQFLTDTNNVLLNSQSYSDKDTCFNGIRSVINNAGIDDRYEKSIDGDGKHFFILKAGNGQEIGRSVKFDSETDVDTAIINFVAEGPNASSKTTDQPESSTEQARPASEDSQKPNPKIIDDYKPLAFYEARISGIENGFDQFDAEDGEFYFTYNLANKVLLISEGYQAEKSRDNGIQSVTKNLPIEARYQKRVHENGKHYFNLRAGNNQEIATSRWFDSESAMDTAIAILLAGGTPSVELLVASGLMEAVFDNGKLYKDYKPLAFYEENIQGVEFGYDSFENENYYYFTVNQDGNPILISEDYTSKAGRDNGIKSVKKNVKNEKRYVRMDHPNGMYYFNLLAGNKQEIATSRWFEHKKDMEKAIYWLTNTGGTRRRKKAVKAKKPAVERNYISQSQPYLCNNITYDVFQSGGNQKYYFVFKDKDGKAVLINGDVRGFASQEDVEAGIKAVLKYGSKSDRYEVRSTKNGKVYFYVQDEDGKNIARSSLFYNTEEEMNAAMALIQCVGATMVGAAPAVAAAAASSEAVIDDYLPCARYAGENGFHIFTNDENGEHYFSYNRAADSKTLLRSEGYTTTAARDNGIASVKKNSPIEERWSTDTALDGKYYYFVLKAGNHQEIARSCYYRDQAAMLADLGWIKGEDSPLGMGSALAGGMMMSANMLKSAEEEKAAALRLKTEEEEEEEEEKNAAAALAIAAAAKAAADAKAQAAEEEKARLAAEAEKKRLAAEAEAEALQLKAEEEEKAAAAKAAADAEAEKARLAAEEEKAAAAALAVAAAAKAAADAKAKAEAEEKARLAAEAEAARVKAEAQAEEQKLKAAALAAAAASAAKEKEEATANAAAYAAGNTGSSGNRGCLRWLLLLIGLLLIAWLLYSLKGCEGCKTAPVVEPDPIITPIDSSTIDTPESTPVPYGKDGDEMGYNAGSLEYLMANHLSGYGSTFPSDKFDADGVTFSRNSSRINSTARKQLDNVIALLKEYPNAKIDIYGYLTDSESGSGNKEISLDDERAKAVLDYLNQGGIDVSRMNFQGEGVGDRRGASIRIVARE